MNHLEKLFDELCAYIIDRYPQVRIEVDTSYYELSQAEPITNGSCTKDGYVTIYMDGKNPNWEEAFYMLLHEIGHYRIFSSRSEFRILLHSVYNNPELLAWSYGMSEMYWFDPFGDYIPKEITVDTYWNFAKKCLKSYGI
jgi:hypothetical protein